MVSVGVHLDARFDRRGPPVDDHRGNQKKRLVCQPALGLSGIYIEFDRAGRHAMIDRPNGNDVTPARPEPSLSRSCAWLRGDLTALGGGQLSRDRVRGCCFRLCRLLGSLAWPQLLGGCAQRTQVGSDSPVSGTPHG